MDIFSRLLFTVYVANLLAKPILFTNNVVVGDESKTPDYIVRTPGKGRNIKRQKGSDTCTSIPYIKIKNLQESARETQKRER